MQIAAITHVPTRPATPKRQAFDRRPHNGTSGCLVPLRSDLRETTEDHDVSELCIRLARCSAEACRACLRVHRDESSLPSDPSH